MRESIERTTVGEIVAGNWRAARVFEQHGIDFCCGGRRTLSEACRTASVDPVALQTALEALPKALHSDADDIAHWPVDRLLDHIVEAHHGYVRNAVPTISRRLAKLVDVHGARHPELAQIAAAFERMGRDLLEHMIKEERALFPYIRALARADGAARPPAPFGSVEYAISAMELEHRDSGAEMQLIRELTGGFVPPASACGTYRVTFAELADFERDLHRHVHLENNVVFPKALAFEQQLSRA